MLTSLAKWTVLILWLGSMGWLVRFEAYPYLFDDTVQGYRELSGDLPALRDSWMKILSNGEHVGYLNSTIEMEDVEGKEELVLATSLSLQVRFQGRPQPLRFQNEVRLNPRHELVSSASSFFLSGISGSLNLIPSGVPNEYRLDLEVNEVKLSRKVTLPDEAIISSPLMDQVLRDVRPGQTLRIRSMDPFSMSGELQTIEITGMKTERKFIPLFDEFLEVTRVESRFGDLVLESDVDEYGRVLWQKTPFGLTFVHSTANRAVRLPEGNALDPAELFSSNLFDSILSGTPTP
jgi:hypothetical protein